MEEGGGPSAPKPVSVTLSASEEKDVSQCRNTALWLSGKHSISLFV